MTSRFRAAMNTNLLNDAARANVLAGIEKVAPTSPLYQVPAVAAMYVAFTTKGGTFTTSVATAASSETQYKASVTARDEARLSFDLALVGLKTAVESNAGSAGDITSMGFPLLAALKASKTVPDPPATVIAIPGKAHGKARVLVSGVGYLGNFVAQVSGDPIGTWTALPGNGKERKLSGYPTGTKLWVQFAQIRWGLQSAWSVPVLVIIP
jgi:hypothetical protein